MSLDAPKAAAFRRLIHELSGKTEAELKEMKPIEKVNAAIDRVNTLEEENEELRDRVAELESQIDSDPTGKDYEDLTCDEKVQKIRETLLRVHPAPC